MRRARVTRSSSSGRFIIRMLAASLVQRGTSTAWIALVALVAGMLLGRASQTTDRGPHRAIAAAASQSPMRSGAPPASATPLEPPPPLNDPRAALGQKLFFDPTLSIPAGTSCGSCHDPAHGYAGVNGSTVGVPLGSRPGHFARRNTPSVLYLRFIRRFRVEWDDESDVPEAKGGFFWDGRADSIAKLVRQPLLNPDEMNNANVRDIADRLERGPYAADLRNEFDGVFGSPEKTVEALAFCLEAFLTSRPMSPFSSKYDDYVRGRASLTVTEARGLALFTDADKGACNGCHRMDSHSPLPENSMFTDYGYDTVAVPRNRSLPSNQKTEAFDLGVCERRDPKLHTEDEWYCGAFRTPSLRNVATRSRFMHNGVFASLRDVVRFYATRGSSPERWYPGGEFDDLPERYRKYVNSTVPPYNRRQDDPPALDDREIDDVVSFLGTLTDRDVPKAP
jgi:cytochrome c peroxidase